MASPQVTIKTLDLSQRVPGFEGVIGAIVVPALKGPVDVPTLVTNDTQFLKRYTPRETVKVGYDISHYSALTFLERSNSLYVMRAHNGALYGGAAIMPEDVGSLHYGLSTGVLDPTAYAFNAVTETAQTEIFQFEVDFNSLEDLQGTSFLLPGGQDYLWFNLDGLGFDPLLVDKNSYEVQLLSSYEPIDVLNAIGSKIASDPTLSTLYTAVPASSAFEEIDVNMPADVAGSLGGTAWVLPGGDNYLWYQVNGTDLDPALPGKTGYEVTLVPGDTADAVALATQSFIAGDPTLSTLFTATIGGSPDIVNLVSLFAGNLEDAYDVNMGISINKVQDGQAILEVETIATEVFLDAYDVDSGFNFITTQQGQSAVSTSELFLLHGVNPGEWNNDLYFKITRYEDNPDKVKEPDTFMLEIFDKDNLNIALETWVLSREQGKKDGYGNNIYLEERLKASAYVYAVDNLTIADNILPKTNTSPIQLGGGDDGNAVTDSQMIAAADKFSNVDDVSITVIMDGGWATPAYQIELINICEGRKDCFAILSIPYAKEAAAAYINEQIDYRKNILNVNSYYGGLYSGWVKVFDRFNGRDIYVAPDGFVGAAISFSALNYEIWYPPAGFRRGNVRALDLRRRYTLGERNALYDAGINPLRFAPGKGIAIFGQKTLQTTPTALDRINVVLLLIVIQPAIAAILDDFIFEFNDTATRNAVSAIITSYMESIKAARGVQDFLVVVDETNNTPTIIDQNKLVVDLYIKPNRAAEFIDFTTIITPSGVSFSSFLTTT